MCLSRNEQQPDYRYGEPMTLRDRGLQRLVPAMLLCVGAAASGCADSPRPAVDDHSEASANPFRIGRPLVIPHGGGDGLFPEDTLFAYQHSISLGGDVVDADVQLTADNVPIAFHDSTVDRTTNGTGSVNAMTYAELSSLDAGWGFVRDGKHPYRGVGITIPTIEAVLDAFPTTLVTLDLKDLRTSAVAPLCSLLRSEKRTDDVFIGVDTTEQVELFRSLCPEVHTSGTDAERRAMRAARERHDTSFVTDQLVSQPEYISADGTKRVTSDSLAYSHSKDIAVLTWVVDDPDEMKTLIEMGIDGIYTRRPDIMVALLRQFGLDQGSRGR